jgi:AcrR family transcriptional regulator
MGTLSRRASLYKVPGGDYTVLVTEPLSLRDEQVAQTRAALVAAGRRLFGTQGFAGTSVDDLAREARVTTGALYHHFPRKAALFEAVFELVHRELLMSAAEAAAGSPDEVEFLARAFEAFLDSSLEPDVQRILIIDAPSVLGPVRFTELDEQYASDMLVEALNEATAAGRLHVEDPETVARLLLGALTRGTMMIANAADPRAARDAVAAGVRTLLAGWSK